MKNKEKKLLKEDITTTASPSYLPQLNQPFTNIVNGLKDENVEWRPVIVRVGQLKPLQKNVTVDKMKSISSDMLDNGKEMDPIFISNDDYILDGHHRAAGLINAKGKDEKIKCIRIDLDKDNGVRMLNKVSDRMEFEEQHKQKEDKPKQVENKNVLRFNKKQLEEYTKKVIEQNLEEYDLNELDIKTNNLTEDNDEGYIKKSYFIDPHPDRISKAEKYGLIDIENEDLTPEGLIQKMIEWDEGEDGVEAYIYDMTKEQLEQQGYKMPDEIRRLSDDVENINPAFHGGYHTDFPGYSLNEDDEDNDVYDIEPGDLVDFGAYGKLYVIRDSGGDRFWVTNRKEDRFNFDASGWFINQSYAKKIIKKEAFEGEGGYEGLMGDDERVKDIMGENELNENELDSDDIEPGDLVNFRIYGRLYVIVSVGDKFWVTNIKEDRFNSYASGWFIKKSYAKNIIEKGNENIDENELEEGPRTHSELRRQKIKSYPEKYYAKSRMRPDEKDISEDETEKLWVVSAYNKRTRYREVLNDPSSKQEAERFRADLELIPAMGKYEDFKIEPRTIYDAHMQSHPGIGRKYAYSLNEKELSEDKINRYLQLKEKYNVKNLPSEELSLEEQDKFMEELINIKENIPNNKRKVRLNEKQFTEMISNIKNEYALAHVPIGGELPSL